MRPSTPTIHPPDNTSGRSLALGFDHVVTWLARSTGRPSDELAEVLSQLGSLLPEDTIAGVAGWQRPVRIEPLPEHYLAPLPLPKSDGDLATRPSYGVAQLAGIMSFSAVRLLTYA